MASPRAARSPTSSACWLPPLWPRRRPRTDGSAAASREMTSNESVAAARRRRAIARALCRGWRGRRSRRRCSSARPCSSSRTGTTSESAPRLTARRQRAEKPCAASSGPDRSRSRSVRAPGRSPAPAATATGSDAVDRAPARSRRGSDAGVNRSDSSTPSGLSTRAAPAPSSGRSAHEMRDDSASNPCGDGDGGWWCAERHAPSPARTTKSSATSGQIGGKRCTCSWPLTSDSGRSSAR